MTQPKVLMIEKPAPLPNYLYWKQIEYQRFGRAINRVDVAKKTAKRLSDAFGSNALVVKINNEKRSIYYVYGNIRG